MSNMQNFIEEVGLEIDILPAHFNPAISMNSQMYHWSCKITKDDKYVVIFFSTGLGLRLWKMPDNSELWPYVAGKRIGTTYDGPFPPHNSYEDQEMYEQCSEPEPPNLAEILECLSKDIATVELADGELEQWSTRFNLDPNDPATKKTYQNVILEAAKIKALLDAEEYQLFIQHSLTEISSETDPSTESQLICK